MKENKYGFNAQMAKENTTKYNEEVENGRKEKATIIVSQWLKTIERDSNNGMTLVVLQSSYTDTINRYIKSDLEELGFSVEKQGQVFRISWL